MTVAAGEGGEGVGVAVGIGARVGVGDGVGVGMSVAAGTGVAGAVGGTCVGGGSVAVGGTDVAVTIGTGVAVGVGEGETARIGVAVAAEGVTVGSDEEQAARAIAITVAIVAKVPKEFLIASLTSASAQGSPKYAKGRFPGDNSRSLSRSVVAVVQRMSGSTSNFWTKGATAIPSLILRRPTITRGQVTTYLIMVFPSVAR
ncbi:MAG: hypothetical protein HY261_10270 [Chloroflexi bacterium]|nr:hypothetical protein [Chloroflexota bacterium]